MTEYAQTILEYLPSYYSNEEEQDYAPFLWESFECNYEHSKFQFAYLAYHMLFMACVYFSFWKVQRAKGEDYNKVLIGASARDEEKFRKVTNPFGFWVINESQFVKLFRLIGLNDRIHAYKQNIQMRNDSAHTNGRIILKSKLQLDGKIEEILEHVQELHAHMKGVLFAIFADSLRREEENFEHFHEVLLRQNYFSIQDMKICLDFDFNPYLVRGRKKLVKNIADNYMRTYGQED